MPRKQDFPYVYLTADVAAFALREDRLAVLLVKRGNPPFKGRLALPGGFVDEGEDVERAARRELREETGVRVPASRLDEVGAYTAPRRDPRHRTVSVTYLAVLGPGVEPVAGDDAASSAWHPVAEVAGTRRLAFDHARILDDALALLRRRLRHTCLGLGLLAPEFTLAELRRAYELVRGQPLDPGNLQRKLLGIPDLLRDTGRRTEGGRGRPATLFTAGGATQIHPPLRESAGRGLA